MHEVLHLQTLAVKAIYKRNQFPRHDNALLSFEAFKIVLAIKFGELVSDTERE